MQGQGGDALMWSVAVHLGFQGGTGQGQPPPVFSLRPPCLSYKQSEMAASCAGLEDSQESQAVNLD